MLDSWMRQGSYEARLGRPMVDGAIALTNYGNWELGGGYLIGSNVAETRHNVELMDPPHNKSTEMSHRNIRLHVSLNLRYDLRIVFETSSQKSNFQLL